MKASTRTLLAQVIELAQAGFSRAEVARKLGVAEFTIAVHRKALGLEFVDGRSKRPVNPQPQEITADLIRQNFEYRDGVVYRTTGIYAGRPAGSLVRGYWSTALYGRSVKIHHIVWLLHHDDLPAYIDHINGDSSNSRIENLRAATATQNSANKRVVWGAVPFKGVQATKSGKYSSCLRSRECGDRWLGTFGTPEEAARAYDAAAVAAFGEFAATNRDLGLLHD